MTREGQSLTFKYDHNGMRIQKVLEHSWYPETTNYTYHGKLLTHMTVAYTDFDEVEHTDNLHFFYDAQSRPAKVSYNGNIYTYLHNLQGDIVGLLDNSGTLIVEYRYDAWGKAISTTGSLADTLGFRNPFRYRGYIYDEESGLYYLRSRYYNPTVGRFVNADLCIGRVGRALSHNVFSYCTCSPVHLRDDSGYRPTLVYPSVGLFPYGSSTSFLRKMVLSDISSLVGDKKDYPQASNLFLHFLWGFGRTINKKLAKGMSTALRKSPKFMSTILSDYEEQGKYIVSSVNFESGDLHYAIGRANYKATVTKDQNILLITGELWDTYDFTEIRNPFAGNDSFFGAAANDFGVYLQFVGEGKAYGYTIPFEMFIIPE